MLSFRARPPQACSSPETGRARRPATGSGPSEDLHYQRDSRLLQPAARAAEAEP